MGRPSRARRTVRRGRSASRRERRATRRHSGTAVRRGRRALPEPTAVLEPTATRPDGIAQTFEIHRLAGPGPRCASESSGFERAQVLRLMHPHPMQPARLSRSRCRCRIRSSRSSRQPADSRAQSLLVGTRLGRQHGQRLADPPERYAETLRHSDEGDPPQGVAGVPALVARRAPAADEAFALVEVQRGHGNAAAVRHLAGCEFEHVHGPQQ